MSIVSSWEKLHRRHQDPGILLIAVWKICRGTVLLLVGVWALAMLHDDAQIGRHSPFIRWCIHLLRLGGSHHSIHAFLVNHGIMHEDRLKLLCIVSSLYSVKLFVEGVGLWYEKIWAQYLTVIVTSLFLPVTVYELIQHGNLIHAAALLVNLLIVAYLAYRLWQRKARHAVSLCK